jgi:hypothetical protein
MEEALRSSLASGISSDISLLIDVLCKSVCHVTKDLIIVADPKLESAGMQEGKNDLGPWVDSKKIEKTTPVGIVIH